MHFVELKPKKTVNLTKEEFNELKVSELSALFIPHKLVIEETDDELKLWMTEEKLNHFKEYPRVQGFEKVIYRSSGVGYISVPRSHAMVDTLYTRFKRAFLK